MNYRPLFPVSLILIWPLAVAVNGITLVEDSQPKATLVLAKRPSHASWLAAKDMQLYLRKISGVDLPLVLSDTPPEGPAILIGPSPAVENLVGNLLTEKNLGYDGFLIKTFGNQIVLAGMDNNFIYEDSLKSNGTRFAVFALLEHLGCRFFAPHPDGEHIPQTETIKLDPLDIKSKPDFAIRWLWNSGRTKKPVPRSLRPTVLFSPGWRSWYVKNRLGGPKLNTSHTYDEICPAELFKTHPEYFPYSRKTGKRFLAKRHMLCLSNPEVVDRAVQACRRYFDRRPDARSASLSPADTGRGWCECDACLAMDDPDPAIGLAKRVLTFNNQVAAELVKTHPDRFVAYYADYGNLPGPTVRRDGTVVLKAHPAVIPVVVNLYCALHEIDDPTCPKNAEYRWRLAAWKKVSSNLLMREWLMPSGLPSPVNWQIGPRMQTYHRMNFIGYQGEVLSRSPDNDLTMYIAAKMLWDADQDPSALIEEFFTLYFQEAAAPMKAYYLRLNKVGRDPAIHDVSVPMTSWTDKDMHELDQLLENARQAARQPLVQRRIQREQTALQAFTVYAHALQAHWHWTKQPTPKNRAAAQNQIARATNFLQGLIDQEFAVARWFLQELDERRQDLDQAAAQNQ